jgi:hypothetical protein
MAEQVSYRLEGCALPEQMHRHSMTKSVRTAKSWHMHTGARRPIVERVTNGCRLDAAARRTDAQEQPPFASFFSSVAQVRHQCRGDFVGERHGQRGANLRTRYTNHMGSPPDVINVQAGDLASAEAICCNQKEHSVIPRAFHRRAIYGAQQGSYVLPWEGADESLAAVMPWRLEAPVQPNWDCPRSGQKPQKGSHDCDNLLHRDSPHAGAGFDHKRLQVTDLDFWQAPHIVLISEQSQKIAGDDPMAQNRRGGESTHPDKVFAIGIDQ